KMLGIKRGDWIIDVCGGTGDLSILAARAAGSSGRVILYDINWAMMEKGWFKVANTSSGKKVEYVQGDAERISFSAQRFDAAMVGFGIRNLTHMEKGFREMYRVLKPGGRLLCLEFSQPTAPLFRRLYDLYSLYIMPRLGEFIVGSKQAYTYLPESIRVFPLPDELTASLEDAGFSHVTHRKLTNGIAVVHLGIKD
ncbi:MAG: ubiquinone/menaquinone biosynthesis methyltransferase, partial [Desulfatiglandales bacterium]|nr:ubiquinone/menaquinone biosynthesis methyltransferase [Desulfatiglandales bacterium]